jgi:hypothetical protein
MFRIRANRISSSSSCRGLSLNLLFLDKSLTVYQTVGIKGRYGNSLKRLVNLVGYADVQIIGNSYYRYIRK